MRKILALILALGCASASSLVAQTVDVYITGSTAFRANVFNACSNLYSPPPTIYYGDSAHGGVNSGFAPKTASWVMTGTPVAGLTQLSGDTLVVHGLFTGSVQGIQTTENGTLLTFAQPTGTAGSNATVYINHTPTIGFSDASAASTPFGLGSGSVGACSEEQVCVQPFVFTRSTAASGPVIQITNVTFEEMLFGIPNGRIPLSAFSANGADTNTFVYLLERTKDSGTRRCFTQGESYKYGDTVQTYIYDVTNNDYYIPSVLANSPTGGSPNGVIGTEGPGLANANLNWGFGYIGGGDIATALGNSNTNNQSLAYLSIADAKSIVSGGANNWSQVIAYNGLWPTLAGPGIHGNNGGTNDYSPILLGYYPLYGFEVLVFPQTLPGDQTISQTQLGDNTGAFPGSFLAVFNAQSFGTNALVVGSVENEINNSKRTGATGIPLGDMVNSRATVGGPIAPPFN